MGYYTSYNLEVRNIPDEATAKKIIEAVEQKQLIRYVFDKCPKLSPDSLDKYALDFYCYDEAKWYEYDEDMIEISKQFPECKFKLYGRGEELLDVWNKYYLRRDHC